jgi:acyl-CoA synthetase (AMP-forming)/AMP-acid ligase II/1-acyl-sn-glycerol-3-phosphate acyltransferase/acyl carrier protein
MLNRFLRLIIRCLLWLRYRIRVSGLDRIAPPDGRGVLFLANHPALIDPIMLMAVLWPRFRPRVLADRAQVRRPGIHFLARRARALEIADMAREGLGAKEQVATMIEASAAALRQGESMLLYPAGRVYRQRREDLGGNSAVEQLLHSVPDVRVVLVRTAGLWGSGFSRASGKPPEVLPVLRKGLWGLVKSGLFFAPRRHVAIDVIEPEDLPRAADRVALNRYLEGFYNRNAGGSTYVPYSLWEGGGVRWLPEPVSSSEPGVARRIPPATRDTVLEYLRGLTGMKDIQETHRLANDLGLDSLVRLEIQAWIESEFGFPQPEVDAIETVGDVMRAAVGETVGKAAAEPRPVAHSWYRAADAHQAPLMPAGDSITAVFLDMARNHPGQVVIADQQSGVRTYRELVTALLLLRPVFARMPGQYVGIMLPASVAATMATMAALFAGKTPVMINWTTGPRGVLHGLDLLDIRCVVTARRLVTRLESEGFASTPGFLQRLIYLEDVAKQFSLPTKLQAAMRARLGWFGALAEARGPEVATVLFTSGSESVPKAVPLTQANLLANIRDALAVIPLRPDEALLGILPPFHSFGLTIGVFLPLLCGLRTVYHVNPNDGAMLGSLIEAYRATLLVGTPTFLAGIVRAAQPGQLATLRLAIAGAEKCPPHVYDALARVCPQITVIEGYGITECSPVVSVNRPDNPRRETIGLPLPSVEHAIVDAECGKPTPCGQRGMLLVRGPSVFGGYFKYDGPSPFVSFAGKQWYRTGDLVSEDDDGVLTFCGRLKRFVKIGGEMIPLAAVEAALEDKWLTPGQAEAPSLAVESTADEEHPELVLFTTLPHDRETANRTLREAGLSPLHNIRRVVRLDAIPLLGTGKTDYRALKAMLSESKN